MTAGPRPNEPTTIALTSLVTDPWTAIRRLAAALGPTGAAQNARRALDERQRVELEVERALGHVAGRAVRGTAEPRGA